MNICIYHANCIDGFGAATVVNRHFLSKGEPCKFHAGVYGNAPPDVTDADVYLVDFSYRRDVIEEMLKVAKSVTIIDHHKSAIEDLADLHDPKLSMYTDVKYSGAVLAWRYFQECSEVPTILRHIQDRDLWKHELHGTNEICASLYSHEFDFDTWDEFYEPAGQADLFTQGISLVRARNKSIKAALEQVPEWTRILGYKVPVVNCSASISSEVAQGLYKMYSTPFAATYSDKHDKRVFSMRSDGRTDVSAIAFSLGGGGHKAAAGFSTSRSRVTVRRTIKQVLKSWWIIIANIAGNRTC